jgi:hypothetical protein
MAGASRSYGFLRGGNFQDSSSNRLERLAAISCLVTYPRKAKCLCICRVLRILNVAECRLVSARIEDTIIANRRDILR